MLLGLSSARVQQQELALEDETREGDAPHPGGNRLMQVLDAVNHRFGRNTLTIASAGLADEPQDWRIKQERLTPGYTTDVNSLAVARA